MLALDLQLGSGAQGMLYALEVDGEHTVVEECRSIGAACILAHALVQAMAGAKRDIGELSLACGLLLELAHVTAHHIVGGIEHHREVLVAVCVDLALRLGVCLEAAMPLQMIGRDVQKHGNLGLEELGGGQLVRGNLGNVAIDRA